MFSVMLTEKWAPPFKNYAPPEIREELFKPAVITFGAVNSNDEAVGIIIARVIGDFLEIIWLYVDEAYRNLGFGASLIKALVKSLDYAPELIGIFADFSEDNYVLGEFLIDNGFKITEEETSLYSFKLSELNQNLFWKKAPNGAENAVSLKEVSTSQLKTFENKLNASEKPLPLKLPINRENYDDELSRAYVNNGKIEGLLLIEKNHDNSLNVAFAYADSNAALPAMIYSAGAEALRTLSPETRIDLAAITEASAKLAEKLFPNVETYAEKRAIYRKEKY